MISATSRTPRGASAKDTALAYDVAIIGTANLDNRSFRLDFEVAAVIYGATMNARLDAVFEADLAHCR